jgi:hypothetical protein
MSTMSVLSLGIGFSLATTSYLFVFRKFLRVNLLAETRITSSSSAPAYMSRSLRYGAIRDLRRASKQ